jgi:hypothetical protein
MHNCTFSLDYGAFMAKHCDGNRALRRALVCFMVAPLR